MSTEPSSSSEGCRRSITSRPSASSAERLSVGSSHRRCVRQREAAPAEHQWVHGERQPALAADPDQPGKAAIVIEMAMAEHDDLDRGRIEVDVFEVDRHPLRRHPGSNSTVCAVVPRRVVTSAEKPCLAINPGNARPSSNCGAGTRGTLAIGVRRAAPVSPISAS